MAFRTKPRGPARKMRPRWRRYAFLAFVFLAAANIVLVLGVFVYFLFRRAEIGRELTELRSALYGRSVFREGSEAVKIYSGSGTLIGEYLPERDSRMTLNRCQESVWMRRAAVSAEDRDFFTHGGVSFRGILRAFFSNLISFSVRQGAGTITQQLARNLWTERDAPALPRKIFETFGAFLIERRLSKNEILCLYINKIYMGEGRLGAEEAARLYFSKPPERLTVAEAAMVAGLFPSPVRYSPMNNIKLSLKKQQAVLSALVRDNHVTKQDAKQYIKEFRTEYGIPADASSHGRIGGFGASRDFRRNAAPAANEYVRQFLSEILPDELVRRGGLRVKTSIDYLRQRSAQEAIRQTVESARRGLVAEAGKKARKRAKLALLSRRLHGVFVSMDPRDGSLRAVVGGYRVAEGGVLTHRAWKMRRQPGSAIKGILYAAALEHDVLRVDSRVKDEPVDVDGYRPRNWYKGTLGEMTLRKAVALSVNTVAVKTLHRLGTSRFQDALGSGLRLDFFSARRRFPGNLSIALGSAEVTPVELASLYAMLLNDGRPVEPRLVLAVEDGAGNTLWKAPDPPRADPLFKPETCAGTVELLGGIFDDEYAGTMQRFGQRRASNFTYLPFPIAGKSGTVQSVPAQRKKFGSSGVHDAWFVGLVPDEVAVVWIGHDEGAPFPGGGSSTAGSAWVSYAQSALPGNVRGRFPSLSGPRNQEPHVQPAGGTDPAGREPQQPGRDPKREPPPADQPDGPKTPEPSGQPKASG